MQIYFDRNSILYAEETCIFYYALYWRRVPLEFIFVFFFRFCIIFSFGYYSIVLFLSFCNTFSFPYYTVLFIAVLPLYYYSLNYSLILCYYLVTACCITLLLPPSSFIRLLFLLRIHICIIFILLIFFNFSIFSLLFFYNVLLEPISFFFYALLIFLSLNCFHIALLVLPFKFFTIVLSYVSLKRKM